MGKPRARAPIASLDSLVSRVRNQKAATNSTPNSSKQQNSKKFTEANDSDDSSSDDSNGSVSDSEVDVEAARKKYTEKQKNKRKGTQRQSTSQSKPTSSTPSAGASKTSKLSTLDADESESGSDESESSDDGHIPAKKPAGKEKSPNKSSNEEESEDESQTSSEGETEDEAANTKQPSKAKAASDDESESSSSGDDVESNHEAMDVDSENEVTVNGNATKQHPTTQVSPPAWIDNSNFVLRKASSDNPAKEVADFFNKTNLEGKQVWYFTAPASLPITVLKDMQIDLSKATTGEALLSHKGDDYGLDLESHATSTQIQLLIPSQSGDKYAALNQGIDSTVHLRRIAKFGPGGVVSATATEDYTPAPKVIREQPQGLKPRFTPIGVPTPIFGPTSSSSVGGANDTKKSKKSGAANGQLKRKHTQHGVDQSSIARETETQGKPSKRPKTFKSTAARTSSAKETPIQAPTVAQMSSAANTVDTPSKTRTPANKEKAKNDKKAAFKPKKETPIPVPFVLSMSMKR